MENSRGIDHGQVQLAIAVEIPHRDRSGQGSHARRRRCAERHAVCRTGDHKEQRAGCALQGGCIRVHYRHRGRCRRGDQRCGNGGRQLRGADESGGQGRGGGAHLPMDRQRETRPAGQGGYGRDFVKEGHGILRLSIGSGDSQRHQECGCDYKMVFQVLHDFFLLFSYRGSLWPPVSLACLSPTLGELCMPALKAAATGAFAGAARARAGSPSPRRRTRLLSPQLPASRADRNL